MGKFEFGSVLLKVDFDNWLDILNIVNDKDVYDPLGKVNDPHITLLYGFPLNIKTKSIMDVIKSNFKEPFEISIENISIFENEKFDVVKFGVKKTNQLENCFNDLMKIRNFNTYMDYKPHITISYLNVGEGKKYINSNYKQNILIKEIIYNKANGYKYIHKL